MTGILQGHPVSKYDLVVPFKQVNSTVQITKPRIPVPTSPVTEDMPNPVLSLSECLFDGSQSLLKDLKFPFLVDVYHKDIKYLSEAPEVCKMCKSFMQNKKECPFCSPGVTCDPSFVAFPKYERKPIFLVVLIGDPEDSLYENLANFPFSSIVAQFDHDRLTVCVPFGSGFQYLQLVDSSTPPNAIFAPNEAKFPHFPKSELTKANLDDIISLCSSQTGFINDPIHLVLYVSVPHTCITRRVDLFQTISVLPSTVMACDCRMHCEVSGGMYLPQAARLPISMLRTVRSLKFTSFGINYQATSSSLLLPGFLLYVRPPINSESRRPVSYQIQLQSDDWLFVFSSSLQNEPGLKNFLSKASQKLFIEATKNNLKLRNTLIARYAGNSSEILIPGRLSSFLSIPPYPYEAKTEHLLESNRLLVVQYLPTERLLESPSGSDCTSMSVLLILYLHTIYIFVGGSVTAEQYSQLLGQEPESTQLSFTLKNISGTSSLLSDIAYIRSLYHPYIPQVVVVPSESGKRVQIVDLLNAQNKYDQTVARKQLIQLAEMISGLPK